MIALSKIEGHTQQRTEMHKDVCLGWNFVVECFWNPWATAEMNQVSWPQKTGGGHVKCYEMVDEN